MSTLRNLALCALVGGLCIPASASALTYNMPGAGTVTLAEVFNASGSVGHYIIFKRASDGVCLLTSVGSTTTYGIRQDIIINGTVGSDVYAEFYWAGGTAPKPTFCGVSVIPSHPYHQAFRFDINLGGGSDVAFVYQNVSNMNVHGGSGNDFLRLYAPPNVGRVAHVYGESGADYVYADFAEGGSGDDIVCSINEHQDTQIRAFGGDGTDTFCGSLPFFPEEYDGFERDEGDGVCPQACKGMFGWP